jgi:dihydroorotase
MRYDLLIWGGTLVTPERIEETDLGIVDGRIAAIGDLRQAEAGERVDARGLHTLPGVIDSQVHFREPGMEHKEDLESGTRAAVAGGVTTVLEMPNTNPATTTRESLEDKLRRAAGRAWCDHGFFVGAAAENVDQLAELETLPGTPGLKIFMGSSTGTLLVDYDAALRQVLLSGRKRCAIHAEDEFRLRERKALVSDTPHPREHPHLRDVECARLATERILALSAETGRPVHVLHISTAEELPMLAEAKRKGLGTTCEVTPQHLTLVAPECYERLGSLAQMNPPIRDEATRQALWAAVREGLFDVMGSDHAPHTLEEKAQPYPKSPSGMPGVQTLLPVMLDHVAQGRLPLTDLVRLTSWAPAALFTIQGKGRIEVGFDADLALVDLGRRWTVERSWLQTKCGWSPFEGMELQGWVEATLVRGAFACRAGAPHGSPAGRPAVFGAP